jgi:hypothetical protein
VVVLAFLASFALDASAAISGIVFRDYNSNGLRDAGGTAAAVDVGIGAVAVRAYDAAGACGTPTTTSSVPASLGTYTLVTTGCSAAAPLRIEFSGFPVGLQPSFHGRPSSGATTAAQAGTSVQFAADGTTNLEVALNEPLQFCQNDPVVAVAEQAFGDPQAPANAAIDSVVRFPYSVAGSTGTPQPVGPVGLADVPLVGTVYGIAFDRRTDQLYMGAYHKRHAGMGPSGTGAIYRVNAVSSGAPGAAALYADLNALFGAGTAGTDSVRGNYEGGAGGDQTWDQVGKSALGDLELSPDGSRLYAVNLADRQLYSIPTSGAVTSGTVTRTPIPAPCANNAADARPFGLEFHNGLLYVGGVCSAQSTQVIANLSAYVYTYDPTAGTFSGTPVFQFALNYPRAAGNQDTIADPTGDIIWRPWSTAENVPAGSGGGIWAQPMLADVAFDGPDLIIGLRDRHGDQTGTGGLGTIRGYTGGDLLRACSNGVGGWNLEQNGTCGTIAGAAGTATNQARGPASVGNTRGGEYYALDHYSNTTPPFFINDTPPDYNGRHDETTQGGIAQTPGYPNVMSTVMDPFSFDSGGVRWFWNTDPNNVALTRGYRIFITGTTGFAKANGLGDLQALCRAAPVEVGNYVWNDLDHDGVMDPGEPPITGVVVNVYTTAGVLLGTATTGANGEFYFIFNQGATDPSTADNTIILPNPYFGTYVIAVAASNFAPGGALATFTPTTPLNAGPGDGLLRDSNGVPVAVPVVGTVTGVTITLNGPGTNDHTIDFGFGALDYGDLPDGAAGTAPGNYNTLVADNGPSHGIVPGLFLGATVDAEANGQPTIGADGDDVNGAPDDEDGITVADLSLRKGLAASIRANATNTGGTAAQLCGFVDFNGDGDFLDAGETAPAVPVPAGSNNVQFTLNFGVVPLTAASATYARFRLSTTAGACTPTGAQVDGEVEDYPVAIAAIDFGDLPDPAAGTASGDYNTREADNGASHTIVPGLFMGATVDPEGDGQPNAAASGDDLNGAPDDEDGVNVADLNLVGGTAASIRVTVTNTTGTPARLCGFIDFNGDGTLETTATATVPTGTVGAVQVLNFGTVPLTAVPATYARFRFDTGVGACVATGAAPNGEVEDYPLGVAQLDYGDLPNTYGTLFAQNGARHPIVPGLRLGANEDAEGDGQPTPVANGDDVNGAPDDEDGITVADLSFTAGTAATVRATASNLTGAPAQLCGFVDFNGDGDFADAGETATPVGVPAGSNNAPFTLNFGTVPLNAAASSYARFRLSTDVGACSPVGLATNGEVEDYPTGVTALDFGDLPDTGAGSGPGNYATLLSDDGPRHPIVAGLFLGANEDAEGDGQPNTGATGDDANGTPDDEDGVNVADLSLIAGQTASVRVTATDTLAGAATLCGFIDFNGDGDFADAGEAVNLAVPSGSNGALFTLNFGTVPLNAAASTYARFRLSTDVGCSATGLATNGEVEDYPVSIGQLDLGDLPDTGAGTAAGNYSTLLADNGPSHPIVAGLQLGAAIDAEADGQPTTPADGDDTNGTPDDEDGVTLADLLLTAGTTANVRVNATNTLAAAAQLCGFIDFNGDGDFADAGETAPATAVPAGSNNVQFTLAFGTVPIGAAPATYARFRLSTDAGACSAVGAATNGEVEDYAVSVGALDWGDLPDTGAGSGPGNYATLDADDGARHVIVPGLRLGANEDAEGNGQPNAAANGDDTNGTPDDEDGINTADLALIAGTPATVRATVTNTTGTAAQLCGFIDFNADGDFADAGETAPAVTVPTGSTNAPFTLSFGTVPLTVAPASYARFRITTAAGACNPVGLASDGEVEDYTVTAGALDLGDLPDTGAGSGPGNYATLVADNGPRHTIVAGLRLGANEDAEGDGQPNAAANGDDTTGTPDDEDGINTADLALIAGTPATVRATATNTTGAAAQLCGFIDLNGDGDFADAGETAPAVTVPTGSTNAPFTLNFGTVPLTVPASSYARFRLSTDAGACSPVGAANDGEVEDYTVTAGALDFGDLPDTGVGNGPGNYATLVADNGPRHPIVAGLRIGANEDAEGDGQPNAGANGDDTNGTPDDEDGVNTADLSLTVGANADVRVTATNTLAQPAQLCGFIDFNGDGDFADAGETAPAVAVPSGSNNALFTVGFGVVPATTATSSYARFRLSTGGGACSPVGTAVDGEVEDYPVGIVARDFGDLPDTGAGSGPGNYATLLADGGASHTIVPNLFIGATVDAEADGQPGAAANGDDANGTPDDEDGVNPADLALQRGVAPNVRVTTTNGTGSAALLCGFIDYNGDGDFADAGETAQVAVPNGTTGAVLTLAFGAVPNSAVATSYARFRLSNDAACAPSGASTSGEVEDYAVNVGSGVLSLGNLVWNDRNNNGTVDPGEPGIGGVAVRLFLDADDNGVADGPAVATTATDAAGAYLFQNLDPGTYLVEIVPPAGYVSSSGSNLPYASTGPYEPAPDPDNDINNDDNGTAQAGVIRAGSVTLAVGAEPVNDGDADPNSNLTVDFGLLGNFDLALTKTVTAGQPGPFAIGSDVSFDITVFNQGGLTAYDILVNEYLPAGFVLSPSETNWTLVSPTLATRTIAGPLAPGASTTVTILLRIAPTATSPLVNRAEIGRADDDTDPGNTLPIDVDSTPDSDPNNDGGGALGTPTDDATSGNGTGVPGGTDPAGDEDDADPAVISLGGGGGPALGLAKAAQLLSITGGDGGYGSGGAPPSADLAYLITVRNYATQSITSLQVSENLVTTFGAGTNWSIQSVTSPTLTTNAAFDGRTVTTLLDGTDSLAAGATATIRLVVTVRFTPGHSYSNLVSGTGLVGGTPVTDTSTDGTDPAAGGTDPGTVQVPTVIRLGSEAIPALGNLALLMLFGGLVVVARIRLRRRGAGY